MQVRLSRPSFTPANKPFVADKAKSVQAAMVASEPSLPWNQPAITVAFEPPSDPARHSLVATIFEVRFETKHDHVRLCLCVDYRAVRCNWCAKYEEYGK
jgi:hypothetical protein